MTGDDDLHHHRQDDDDQDLHEEQDEQEEPDLKNLSPGNCPIFRREVSSMTQFVALTSYVNSFTLYTVAKI